MQVQVDRWAWMRHADLTGDQLDALERQLTIWPRKVGDHPGEAPPPLYLYENRNGHIGVPRQYFWNRRNSSHTILTDFSTGGSDWPQDLKFEGTLEPDQKRGVEVVVDALTQGQLGGILQAVPGYGKTVTALAIIAALNVPTLILVHKSFLIRQWKRRIERFLPSAKVGIARQDKCQFEGKNIVLGMNTSLYVRDYGPEFYNHFGLVVSDEVHRLGASTWSQVIPKFNARWRLGLSATPRRPDGTENAFFFHIGPILFVGSIERLPCRVKRVFSGFEIPESLRTNAQLVRSTLATKLLCANRARNELIVTNLIRAVQAGRKVMVMSAIRDRHLLPLEAMFRRLWPLTSGPVPTTSFYLGGMKEEELERAEEAQVIFATAQMAKEGLDIPQLDTLFLTTPMGNVEQAVGRIQRAFTGKKEPMVVDFRDDNIGVCRRLGEMRWNFYSKKGWVSATPA